jgi:hypothetical protein
MAKKYKRRSPPAKALADRLFHQRVVRDRTKYTRKEKHKARQD